MKMVRKGERRSDPDGPRPLADAVLRLIWREKRISRADIAQEAELSRSTVSEVVNEILPTGLVAEVGLGKSSGGRRPVLLEFQDDTCVILGVDMGAEDVKGIVIGGRNNSFQVMTRGGFPEGKDVILAPTADGNRLDLIHGHLSACSLCHSSPPLGSVGDPSVSHVSAPIVPVNRVERHLSADRGEGLLWEQSTAQG